MAPERVYLHIGAPKTGTTYLQARLAANRAALKADGILYPASIGDAHHTAGWELRGTPPQREGARGIEGAWAELVRRAREWDGEAVVVSSELLVYCDEAQIRTALSAFDSEVHVIYTARDLVRQVPAVWQERVKNQQTVSYSDFLRAVTRSRRVGGEHAFWLAQDAAAVIERWSHGLRPDQLHVVTAPPAGSPLTVLWDRFAGVLGRRGDSYSTEISVPANRSLTMLQTELLRRYNERHGAALAWPVYRRTIRTELDKSFAAVDSDERKLRLPSAHHDFFAAASGDIVASLRRAGCDVSGDLDDLLSVPVEAADLAAGDATDVSDAEVLNASLDVLHAILSRERELRKQRRAERSSGGS